MAPVPKFTSLSGEICTSAVPPVMVAAPAVSALISSLMIAWPRAVITIAPWLVKVAELPMFT